MKFLRLFVLGGRAFPKNPMVFTICTKSFDGFLISKKIFLIREEPVVSKVLLIIYYLSDNRAI